MWVLLLVSLRSALVHLFFLSLSSLSLCIWLLRIGYDICWPRGSLYRVFAGVLPGCGGLGIRRPSIAVSLGLCLFWLHSLGYVVSVPSSIRVTYSITDSMPPCLMPSFISIFLEGACDWSKFIAGSSWTDSGSLVFKLSEAVARGSSLEEPCWITSESESLRQNGTLLPGKIRHAAHKTFVAATRMITGKSWFCGILIQNQVWCLK